MARVTKKAQALAARGVSEVKSLYRATVGCFEIRHAGKHVELIDRSTATTVRLQAATANWLGEALTRAAAFAEREGGQSSD